MPQRVSIKDSYKEKRIYAMRISVVMLAVVAMLSLLGWRYFSLQILDHETYRTQSDRNRVQLQPIPPRRGLIYDRNGVLLAENVASYELTIVKEQVGDLEETLATLRSIVELNDDHIKKFKQLIRRRRPYHPITLKAQLSETEIAALAVNRYRLPGVDVDARLSRFYPQGEYFAHALGYVGRISEAEQAVIDEINYRGTHYIGKIGLEQFYEDILHGQVGYQNVETNARGRVLRILERQDPQPGEDLHLYLDSRLQKVAHDALGAERGSVVAIDTKTGGVLALVSTPSFDANLFVNGISRRDYARLRDSLDLPLFNRSLQGQYPPGSTVKPIIGLAGLHYEVITPQFQVSDPGWFQLPNDDRFYRDWKKGGHAPKVALEQAVVESCDTYYYELAYSLGIDRIHEFAKDFGLGSQTGIDTTHERSGLLPSREWKRKFKRLPWFPGETINVGIGQGYMLTTPLQLAVSTAVIANRGVRYTPRLLRAVGDKEQPVPKLPPVELKEQYWNTMFKAMRNVVHGRRGTAQAINRGAKYRMAGKTGTAQVVGIAQDAEYDSAQLEKRQWDHALFIGFAPLNDPRIAVAIIVENGEHGSSAAAPIARRMFDDYLLRGKKEQVSHFVAPKQEGSVL